MISGTTAMLMGRVGGATVWTPPIAGYVHLWDVSNQTTLTTVLWDGFETVSQIDNQGSASSVHMVSTVNGQRPIWPFTVGSQYGMNCDGSNDWMQAASCSIDGDHTVFIVCDIESTDTRVLLEHSANWNTNNGMIINPDSSTQMGYGIRRSSTNSARYASTGTTGLHCWTFRADGTHANQTIRKDGTGLSTTSVGAGYNSDVGTGNVTTTLNMASRNTGSLFLNAGMGMALIYNTTLSDGDCSTTEASLKAHWGTP